MTYSLKALRSHPGANPDYSHPSGRAYPAIATYRINGREVRVISIRDRSRWKPHNGKHEMSRRVRQMQRGVA